jgi:ribonuclease E
MTVIDVNTGKYTGTGGNLEETVTRNNLEAAEEIVRQLRLRDMGGIIVIDFIDMVLESNRELVLRRLTECLGRDRTKHQVTEITSLGLVQMTRKRVGAGLLEAFSEPCEHCKGRGVIVHTEPVGDRPKSNAAADKVKAVASATTGRRRGRRSASPPPATVPEDDTMGYDLSRFEDVAPVAPDVTGPADLEPVEPLALDGPAATSPAASSQPPPLEFIGELAPDDEAGRAGVFRRFRRPRGRHRP